MHNSQHIPNLNSPCTYTTWETHGSRHVQVLGIEDKKKVTSIVSFSTNGSMLHLQIVLRNNKLFIPIHE
jgi:hypothetical protein